MYQQYSLNYLMRDIGPKLWNLLSEALREKIAKPNFRSVMERRFLVPIEEQSPGLELKMPESVVGLMFPNSLIFYLSKLIKTNQTNPASANTCSTISVRVSLAAQFVK